MPLGAEHKEPTESFYFFVFLGSRGVATKLYVHTASCHIGCYYNASLASCLRNDLAFALVVFCIQNFVWHSFAFQISRKKLVLFNRHGTNEHGLTFAVELFYLACNGFKLTLFGLKDQVVLVDTRNHGVGGSLDHIETIHLIKFLA